MDMGNSLSLGGGDFLLPLAGERDSRRLDAHRQKRLRQRAAVAARRAAEARRPVAAGVPAFDRRHQRRARNALAIEQIGHFAWRRRRGSRLLRQQFGNDLRPQPPALDRPPPLAPVLRWRAPDTPAPRQISRRRRASGRSRHRPARPRPAPRGRRPRSRRASSPSPHSPS